MSDVEEGVRAGNRELCDALARGDSAGMAALYTRDGQVLPTGSDAISGRAGIAAFWQGVIDLGIAGAELETVEIETLNGAANEIGRYVLSAADGSVVDRGKYLVVWKHFEGRWSLHWDIWNSSVAPESAS